MSTLLGTWVFVALLADGSTLSSPVVNFNLRYDDGTVYALEILPIGVEQRMGCRPEGDEYECYSSYPPPWDEFYVSGSSYVLHGWSGESEVYGWRIGRAQDNQRGTR